LRAEVQPQLPGCAGSDVSRRIVYAYVSSCSDASPKHYHSMVTRMGLQAFSKTQYNKIMDEMRPYVAELLKENTDAAVACLKSEHADDAILSSDGAYAVRGHQSRNGTVHFLLRNEENLLLAATHGCPKVGQSGNESIGNTVWSPGSAKNMEAHLSKVILDDLIIKGVKKVFIFVEDADAAVRALIQETFRDALIISCANHRIKGLTKEFFDVCKGKKHTDKTRAFIQEQGLSPDDYECSCAAGQHKSPSSETPGCGCASDPVFRVLQAHVHAVLYQCKDSMPEFKRLMGQLVAHFCGDHFGCTFHAQTECHGNCACPTRVCGCGE
jgi:hypothetical protein